MAFTDKALQTEFLNTCARLREGRLTLRTPDGARYSFGETGPEAEMQINDWAAVSAMAAHGQTGLGEAYVQGLWDTPSVEGLMQLAMRNRDHLDSYDQASPLNRAKFRIVDTLLRANSKRGARKNIRAHYDVGNEFYQLWLDDGMTYSSGLFGAEGDDLAQAQTRKNDRILSRLGDGERVLEIGCGWGGFAEFAAREIGCKVTGITISNEQLVFAQNRIAMAGLSDKVDFRFCDYRELEEQFDRIVSIEMFEAVGESYWPTYFEQVHNCLKPGGKAGLQIITISEQRFESYRKKTDFIQRYIFPGGMLPSPERLDREFASADLSLLAREDFAHDYARTLEEWRHRFLDVWPEVKALGFDERFRNMWEYYLAYCEAGFSTGSIDVSHFTVTRD